VNIVLDTNILLTCISRKSHIHWIFENLLNGTYNLCVTTDVLLEYAEVIERHMGIEVAEMAMETILNLPNLIRIHHYYRWQLIPNDADDNKFVDCAIAGDAQYIVTHDKHFKSLKEIDIIKVEVITAEEFREILES